MAERRSWGKLRGWFRWDDAREMPEVNHPGVYLLAHFSNPPRKVDTKDKRIVYIGETAQQTLRKRWGPFHRCAFHGTGIEGHSGGMTYAKLFGRKYRKRLFVAFATPDDDDVVLPFRIRFLERKWLLDFVLRHGRPPPCNRK